MSSYGLLHISALPSLKTLQLWQTMGIEHLVNVSGIDIIELCEPSILEAFTINQFSFNDVFTKADIITSLSNYQSIIIDSYLAVSHEIHRLALLEAVQTVINQLQLQIQTCVFCHRGLGRSPLVVAAALQQFYDESISQAIIRTYAIQPHAQFTEISLSALQWCQLQLKG